jgi:hypothetical protein
VTFDNQPGYTTCKGCGAKLFLTLSGQLGVFPREGWKPGGFGSGAEGEGLKRSRTNDRFDDHR